MLIVDACRESRDRLAEQLSAEGHRVVTAATVADALAVLNGGEFDLALIDVSLPDADGIDLLSRMKGDARLHAIPVLMAAARPDDDAVIRCIAAGAEDCLPKPVDTLLLGARISACLERRQWREREHRYLREIEDQKARISAMLETLLPERVVRRLEDGEEVIADRFEHASIIFTDIVDFSPMAASTPPAAVVERLGALFSRFDELADEHGVEKIKTIGDAYLAAAGVPEPRADHADAAVSFGLALLSEIERQQADRSPLTLRIGIHSGPVIAGLLGRKRLVYDIWGHTVNVASRLEASGAPGRIQISESTLRAMKDPPEVVPQGRLDLKGIGTVPAYLLAAGNPTM